MLLAQAETIGKVIDKTTQTAGEQYGLIGILLVLCLVGMGSSLWMFGRFLARRDDLERDSRDKSEQRFLEALKEQQDKFDRQINEQRKQSLELGKSGQLSVTVLAEAFHELNMLLCSEAGFSGVTESAIHRRREARKNKSDSVLEH